MVCYLCGQQMLSICEDCLRPYCEKHLATHIIAEGFDMVVKEGIRAVDISVCEAVPI